MNKTPLFEYEVPMCKKRPTHWFDDIGEKTDKTR